MDYKGRIGEYIQCSVAGERYTAYMPKNLPPDPPLDLERLYPLLEKASTALGRLDGMTTILPDASLFLYMYVRKEAVLSSQIEGTQSSLSDLLLFESNEAPSVPMADVTEVSRYVSAMNYGLERLNEFPLSLRLMREIHAKLMAHGRGSGKQPGEFRRSQNWIGGTRLGNARFVPPPHERLMEAMGALETFLHDENIKLPVLVKAALAHVQFETIHPFLDGNGRLGRLLITFILCVEGVLKEPLLYLSLYFKANRQEYYDHLQSVRETGAWEEWIAFFLEGVIETANQAMQTAQSILRLFERDRALIEHTKKSTASTLAIYNYLQSNPITNSTRLRDNCGLSRVTVLRSIDALESIGIVKEVTGKQRHKVFVYDDYIGLLSEGTEPIGRGGL